MKSPVKVMLKQCGGNQAELARRLKKTRQHVSVMIKSGIIPDKHALLCEELFTGVKAMDILNFNRAARQLNNSRCQIKR